MGILNRIFGQSNTDKRINDIERVLNAKVLTGHQWAGDSATDSSIDDPLTIPAVWSAVSSNAQAMATLSYPIYDNKNERNKDHYAYELLNVKPNEYQTPAQLWIKFYIDLQIHQEAFLYATRSGTQVLSIENVDPKLVTNEKGEWKVDKVPVDPYYLWHFCLMSKDGKRGTNPYKLAKNTVEFAQSLEKTGLAYYKSGMKLNGFLTLPQMSPEDEQKSMKDFKKLNKASTNAGGIAGLPNGFGYIPNSATPQDAQYADVSIHQMRQAGRLTNTPAYLQGDLERQTWGNMGLARLDWSQRTLRPMAVTVEQRINLSLFTKEERKSGLRLEINLDAIERGSFAEQIITLTQAAGGTQLLTQNEARKILNFPELGDEGANSITSTPKTPVNPLNNGVIEENKKENDANNPIK